MTLSTLTFFLYVGVVGILMWRFFAVLSRLAHLAYDPAIPAWKKYLLADRVLWRRVWAFSLDVVFSLVFGFLTRIMIAGVAGGPVGAVCGLAVSAMIHGSGAYREHVKSNYSAS